jgi:hypothetical protein
MVTTIESVTLNGALIANGQTLSASVGATVQVLNVRELPATGETDIGRTAFMLVIASTVMLLGWLGYRCYRYTS